MRKIINLLVFLSFFIIVSPTMAEERFWQFQSVDTMKYSRDVAREKLRDSSYDKEIEFQVFSIAQTGATHVGIATPYDAEFIPFLKRWVIAARRHNLKVWFRGNLSGWEGWFGYPKITRATHLTGVVAFIKNNPDLFEDGDIFTPCPECENGGPGDPRANGDAAGHKKFLIEEYEQTKKAFSAIKKDVMTGFFSMNGDVARLIMDKDTTAKTGGLVVVDHYVRSPEQLVADIRGYAQQSGGIVILGEFGSPIPDIHGNQTESEQAEWIDKALTLLLGVPEFKGINYWVNKGGSTRIWNDDSTPRQAVETLTSAYRPYVVKGTIYDVFGNTIPEVSVRNDYISVTANTQAQYAIPIRGRLDLTFNKTGYKTARLAVDESVNEPVNLILEKESYSLMESLRVLWRKLWK